MLIVKKLVKKSEIFNVFDDSNVESFKVIKSRNKTLRDPTVCQIELNYKFNLGEIHTVIGSIEKLLETFNFNDDEVKFLKSLLKKGTSLNFKRYQIEDLMILEEKYDINFSICKRIRKIIKNYIYHKLN